MSLKLVNLNLWHGNLLDQAITFLKTESPDIISLQEVYNGPENARKNLKSFSVLRKTISLPHSSYSPCFYEVYDGISVDSGNAVFSRLPIVETNTIFFDIPYRERPTQESSEIFTRTPRSIQHVRLSPGNISIFNVHGIWGTDGEDNPRRMKMCKTIADAVKDEDNSILSGDFNVRAGTRSIRQIERHMSNVFEGRLVTSFNMKRKFAGGFSTSVVDMIFASPSIRILESYCPDVDVSDHMPLVVIFDVKK